MRTLPCLLVCVLLYLCFSVTVHAQDLFTDSVVRKLSDYHAGNSSPALFLHFDKNVYTANETAWFTAYLLNRPATDTTHTLSVSLVSDADRTVVLKREFLVFNGLAFGDLSVPDSLPAGRYHFNAFTNHVVNGIPQSAFTQPITLKTTTEPPFQASLKLLDTVAADGFYKVLFEGFTKDKMLLKNAALSYNVTPGETVKARTNERGEYLVHIPIKDVTALNNTLRLTVSWQKDKQGLSVRLPVAPAETTLRFYPEGGYLIDATPCIVGWEAKRPGGIPVQLTGVLFCDGAPADTIFTSSLGIGKFLLTPVKGSTYFIRPFEHNLAGKDWPLPLAIDRSPAISANRSVVDDTLKVTVRNIEKGGRLVLHNFNEVFISKPIPAGGYRASFKIALDGLPRGLAALTIFDEEDRPRGERLIFAHYNQREALTATTDKPEYKPREKVTLSLLLKDAAGKPLRGIVSIACVQENRLETGNVTDIETYAYLVRLLGNLPADPMGEWARNKGYIENILLVKGWRKYSWQEAMAGKPAQPVNYQSLQFTGSVTYFKKPLKKPVAVSLLRDSAFSLLQTDKTGTFLPAIRDLILAPDKKLLISVNEKQYAGYDVRLNDPYLPVSARLAREQDAPDVAAAAINTTGSLLINRNERTIMMKEISLTSKKDDNLFGTRGFGVNACGDYVCMYNILNCPNHNGAYGNKEPVEGRIYLSNGARVVYSGCVNSAKKDDHVIRATGIYLNKEFYGSDYSELSPSQPEYFSTIFWKHGLLLNEDGTASAQFYTSDITGRFKVVVQGLTSNDVVFGEQAFTVTKPK
ncbi:hypothetical protein [Hufsiella ginkgonis]|uniref:Macroglobulin domain-containing protein n=1 Tax=Hufsiella ginkgonis TaxID=2695274 RepID=A0A7K1Y2B0_9SPHI|nr:hypothetical protein [Hufsiella ginkgonis]MXV17149.1 hypothetical protein [Hufsiella ginkgonis]